MSNDVHVGDIGTVFEIVLKDKGVIVDVSGATVKTIKFRKPNSTRTVITKTAVFSNTGSDGKIKYVSIAGDIDTEGEWKIQAEITLPSGKWNSGIGTFMVENNLL